MPHAYQMALLQIAICKLRQGNVKDWDISNNSSPEMSASAGLYKSQEG
jgi:hypothetical protein